MIHYIVRLCKRIVVLLPGIAIAFFSVHTVYPLFDKRVSAVWAIFFTYVLAAYVLIPAALRFLRIIFPAHHLPLYCVTPDGFASDPINIGIVATKEQMIQAMKESGWFVADKRTPKTAARQVLSTILSQPYKTAPMSSLFLFGRKQDVGFERPLAGKSGGGHRHHVRFWATTFDEDKPLSIRSIHWFPRRKHIEGERLLWLGAASRDIGLSFIRHNAQVTHMIDPDTNQEREMIVNHLAPLTESIEKINLVEKPYKLSNRAWRGYLLSDGVLKVCKLRQQKQ